MVYAIRVQSFVFVAFLVFMNIFIKCWEKIRIHPNFTYIFVVIYPKLFNEIALFIVHIFQVLQTMC